MSLSSHTFEYDINLSADKIYSKTLQSIKKLKYKLIDEDKKNKTIIAKSNKENNYWGQNLTINISNKFISIKAEVNQLMVYKKSKEISDSIIKEISKSVKLSSSKDKINNKKNIRLKNSAEHNRSAAKDKSNIKKVWWSIAAVFVGLIVLISLFGDNSNSTVTCRLSYHNSSYCNYQCTRGDETKWTFMSNPGTCPTFPKYFKWD